MKYIDHGNIVFSDKEKLKILEDLTHTVIIDKVRKYIDNLTSEEKNVIFIEIPLYERAKELIHSKIKVDAVWYVSCRCEVQLERLMRRNHLSEQEANQRIKVQRQNHPTFDVLISNDGSIDSLYRKVQNLLDKEKL